MINILPIDEGVQKKIDRHNIRKKFEKQLALFIQNPQHPSLHVELLEPKERGIWSFRIDRKYRALFLTNAQTQTVHIITVTTHYQ